MNSQRGRPLSIEKEIFNEDELTYLKRDMNVNIAHAGLDIIRSRDPLYKAEMKKIEEEKAKNNGS